jgi:hypothetical protein
MTLAGVFFIHCVFGANYSSQASCNCTKGDSQCNVVSLCDSSKQSFGVFSNLKAFSRSIAVSCNSEVMASIGQLHISVCCIVEVTTVARIVASIHGTWLTASFKVSDIICSIHGTWLTASFRVSDIICPAL